MNEDAASTPVAAHAPARASTTRPPGARHLGSPAGTWAFCGGFLLLVGAVVLLACLRAYSLSSGPGSDGAAELTGAVIGLLILLVGTLVATVGAVAKGVQISRTHD